MDRKVLKWFGHVERMGDERLTKKVYKSEVGGERGVGRPCFRWIDAVKEACDDRKIGLTKAKSRCWNRSEWRSVTDKILKVIVWVKTHLRRSTIGKRAPLVGFR